MLHHHLGAPCTLKTRTNQASRTSSLVLKSTPHSSLHRHLCLQSPNWAPLPPRRDWSPSACRPHHPKPKQAPCDCVIVPRRSGPLYSQVRPGFPTESQRHLIRALPAERPPQGPARRGPRLARPLPAPQPPRVTRTSHLCLRLRPTGASLPRSRPEQTLRLQPEGRAFPCCPSPALSAELPAPRPVLPQDCRGLQPVSVSRMFYGKHQQSKVKYIRKTVTRDPAGCVVKLTPGPKCPVVSIFCPPLVLCASSLGANSPVPWLHLKRPLPSPRHSGSAHGFRPTQTLQGSPNPAIHTAGAFSRLAR